MMQPDTMPMVPAPLTAGDTATGYTGITVFEVFAEDTGLRQVAIGVVQSGGEVLGGLLDDDAFDTFCKLLAPIVAARANEVVAPVNFGTMQ